MHTFMSTLMLINSWDPFGSEGKTLGSHVGLGREWGINWTQQRKQKADFLTAIHFAILKPYTILYITS